MLFRVELSDNSLEQTVNLFLYIFAMFMCTFINTELPTECLEQALY